MRSDALKCSVVCIFTSCRDEVEERIHVRHDEIISRSKLRVINIKVRF